VGAVGSVISINAAGLLIGVGLPIEKLFMLVALLMAAGTIGWLAIMRLYASNGTATIYGCKVAKLPHHD
jgi:hypothetical protein